MAKEQEFSIAGFLLVVTILAFGIIFFEDIVIPVFTGSDSQKTEEKSDGSFSQTVLRTEEFLQRR